VLAEISYTASTNPADTRAALRSVRFWYQPRPDVRTEYVSGLRLSHGFRLGEIEVRGPGQRQELLQTLKEYRLRYISGSSGRSLLTSLTECEDSTLMAMCRGSSLFGYSRNEDEFEEILLKARAPMAAIARTVTGSDAQDAWSVELEPARAEAA